MSAVAKPTSTAASQCLATVLALHGKPVNVSRVAQQFRAPALADSIALVRAARELDCQATLLVAANYAITQLPTPCIIEGARGMCAPYFVLAKVTGERCLVQQPDRAPEEKSVAELQGWIGQHAVALRPDTAKAGPPRFTAAWFVPALWRYRTLLAEVLGASCLLQIFALATPLVFQVVVDKVLAHGALNTLDVLILGLSLIVLFEAVLGGLRNFVFAHTTSRVDIELGARLFGHLLSLPLAYFQARATGQTVARVRELENIRSFLTNAASTVIIDALFLGVFLLVMFAYSPLLCGVVLATLPLYAVVTFAITPTLRRRVAARFQCNAQSQAFLIESVSSTETIKSMAIETQQRARWETLLARFTRASFKANSIGIVGTQSVQFISRLGSVVLLWLGAHLVIDGSISIGQLIAFNMLAGQVSAPLLRLAQLWQDFQQFRLSVAQLGDVLNTPPESAGQISKSTLTNMHGALAFKDVHFRYAPEHQDVLQGLHLEVTPGETIGIVGRSGSGKSTLTRLIQCLYTPTRGRILIDGVDAASLDARWLRSNISVVLQDSVLFTSSVRENLAAACPQAPLERIQAAAQLAGAHGFITNLPDGYDTLLEERGSNLSGGQCQRLAIARALMTNPRILILDEATSALDYESERIVQDNMQAIAKGRTVLIIAHRLSTVRKTDRIVVLDSGKVVEQGAHDALVARAGPYARLWRQQAA